MPEKQIIWMVEGWFGDVEWIESIHSTQEGANAVFVERCKTRTSTVLPDDHFVQKLCKFAVVPHEVKTP